MERSRLIHQRRPWLFDELRSRYEHPLEIAAYTRQIGHGLLAEEKAMIERVMPEPCPTLVLGCGAGREVFPLAHRGYDVTGADISQGMLRAAQRAQRRQQFNAPTPTIRWVWMNNPLHIPLPDAAFSLVIAFAQVLSHIPNEEARIELLKEVHRVLQPGGTFIATFTLRDAASELLDSQDPSDFETDLEIDAGWEQGDLLIWHPSEAELEDPLFFHLHTYADMTNELEAAHFEQIEFFMPHDLTDAAAPDGHLYPFVVARRC